MNEGEKFIHQKYSTLHTSKEVEHEQERKKRIGEEITQKPTEKLSNWMDVLDQTHMGHKDDPRVLERIKKHYHKEHIIKTEDIPESAFLMEQRIARNLGYGDVEITDEFIERKTEQIISDQKHSLDKWINYLTSPDAKYPTWAKYWAFRSMLSMGKLEKYEDKSTGVEKAKFRKRKDDTIAPFPPLNPRALAMTISAIVSKAEENAKNKKDRIDIENISTRLDDKEFKQLLSTENFSKIYTQFLIEMPEYSAEGLKETRGRWVKYDKGSKPDRIVESLEGYPLEWCTANIDTARTQLQAGDFHIYYSLNDDGEAVIPRVAIRMEGNSIAEVRGIATDQNMDPYISDVVEEKMNKFPDGEQYKKKNEDMRKLTEIEKKTNLNQELSIEDLRFLYEIDFKIEGFGYERDPRIQEILERRDNKSDISSITGYSKDQISITRAEALSGDIKYHYNDLDLNSLTSAEGLTLPESIGGSLNLSSLTSAEGLTLPESIGGYLNLSSLTSAEKQKLRKKYPNKTIF